MYCLADYGHCESKGETYYGFKGNVLINSEGVITEITATAANIEDNKYLIMPDAKRFKTWEQNIATKIGLGVAIEYAIQLGIPAI